MLSMANLAEVKKGKLGRNKESKIKSQPLRNADTAPAAPKPETFELFDYQRQDAETSLDKMEAELSVSGKGRGLLDMATGLGKTRTAIEIIKKVTKKPKRILILADKVDLLEQHKIVFSSYLGDEYAMTDFTGKSFLARKTSQEYEIVFATRQSMRNFVTTEQDEKTYLPSDYFDFIVDDESHHAKAETYEPTLRHFQPNYLLGMTGTRDRSDWKDIREIFGEVTTGELDDDGNRVGRTLEEGMSKGWLTPVDYDLVTMDIDEDALARLVADEGKNLSREELERLIFKEKSLEEVVDDIVKKAGDKHTAIMCSNVLESEKVAQILRDKHGMAAEAFHSRGENDDGELVRFRAKSTTLLASVDKLNEGVDVPEMECVAFIRSTESKRIFLQQLGRVLRKYPGKKRSLVLDYVGTLDRLDFINQLMLDITGRETVKNSEDEKLEKRIIGGENVFKFNREIVKNVNEILKRNERRFSREVVDRKSVEVMNMEQVKKLCAKLQITTFNLYNFWSPVVFPLDGYEDFQGVLPDLTTDFGAELGLLSTGWTKSDLIRFQSANFLGQIVVSIKEFYYWNKTELENATHNPWFPRDMALMKPGVSRYRATEADLKKADKKVEELEKDFENSVYNKIANKNLVHIDHYGLHFPEAINEAKMRLREVINILESRGLLTQAFFMPEILDSVIEDIAWQVHSEYFGYEEEHAATVKNRYKKAVVGPYKGSVAKLSEVLAGATVEMNLSSARNKVKELRIKTTSGYELWLNRVFKNNLVLRNGYRKHDGYTSTNIYGLKQGSVYVDRFGLPASVLVEDYEKDFASDVSNFLYEHFTFLEGKFVFIPNKEVIPTSKNIAEHDSRKSKIGVSDQKLDVTNLPKTLADEVVRKLGKQKSEKVYNHVVSIYKILEVNSLYSKIFNSENTFNAVVKYVLRVLHLE